MVHDVCRVSDSRCETSSDISERSKSTIVAEVALSAIRRVHRSIYIVASSLMRAISSRHRSRANARDYSHLRGHLRGSAQRGSFGNALAARAREVKDRPSAVLTTRDARSHARKSHCRRAPERVLEIEIAIRTWSIRIYRTISWLIKHRSSARSKIS